MGECRQLRVQRLAGGPHRRAHARHRGRPAVLLRLWVGGVAQLAPHPRHGQAEGIGGGRRRRGVSARPHVGRRAAYLGTTVAEQRRRCGGEIAFGRIDHRRHAIPDQLAPVAHHAWLTRALAPPGPLRALRIAFAQALGRPGKVLAGIALDVVAQPKLDRVDADPLRELVHRHLQPDQAGRPARASGMACRCSSAPGCSD